MKPRALLSALLLLPAVLAAQPRDHDRKDRDDRSERAQPREYRSGGPRVILYEHSNFRGDALVLYPGDEILNLDPGRFEQGARINDRISSIRVEGGAELFVYEHAGFRGHVMRVTGDIRNLADRPTPDRGVVWNDRISSVQVGRESRRGGRERPADADVIIGRSFEDLLGRAPDADGLRHYRGLIIDQGWNERMVRDHIRAGAEFRGAGIDRIIKRAYHDLLQREPDAPGLAHYRRMLLERNWSEQELRDNIRRSDEYRRLQKQPRAAPAGSGRDSDRRN